MNRTQFTFYDSFYKAVTQLWRKSDQADVLLAICRYALYEEVPDLAGPPAAIFELVKPILDAGRRKAKSGQAGGAASAQRTAGKGKANPKQEKEQEKEQGQKSPPTPRRGAFSPPTAEQVEAYCREKGYAIDPESFVAFYASKGWRVGSSPMKDWRAAVVTWVRRQDRTGPAEPPETWSSERLAAFQARFHGEGGPA